MNGVERSRTELLPCPFCGGEAEVTCAGRGQYQAQVRCRKCGVSLGKWFRSKAAAASAWNARAYGEATVEGFTDEMLAAVGYRKERMCTVTDTTSPTNDDYWTTAKCSECGAEYTIDFRFLNYCPNCGAKVVQSKRHSKDGDVSSDSDGFFSEAVGE